MKLTKLMLTAAMAGTMAMACNKSAADLILTVSGSAEIQTANTETAKDYKGSTETYSFNDTQIYLLLSNAVANASSGSFDSIHSTNLPANGYIAFDPEGFDGGPEDAGGYFYVTNKTGFYYRLSGKDAHTNYYSWIELDSENTYYEYRGFAFGWVNGYRLNAPLNGVSSYNISTKNQSGTVTDTSTALLYIHDDPYCYDDADNPNIFWNNHEPRGAGAAQGNGDDAVGTNYNAIEIRGIMKATLTLTNNVIKSATFSLTGTGNLALEGNFGFLVKSATAKLAK